MTTPAHSAPAAQRTDSMIDIRLGDCLTALADLPEHSLDSLVSDWPAGVAFMGPEVVA